MAKMNIDQFREFSSAVVRHLPEISPEDAQLLIEEQERLTAILRVAFTSSRSRDFQIVMDGTIPLHEGVTVWERINVENAESWLPGGTAGNELEKDWPTREGKASTFQFAFEKPGFAMSGNSAKKWLEKKGFRMATLMETTWFLNQWANFIPGAHYCEKPLLTRNDFVPLVMASGINGDYLTVVSGGEMHSDYMGRVMLDDATYAAIKPWDGK